MKEIFTEIKINAPANIVWDILTDLESYNQWNPFIRESKGQAVLGCRLTCRPLFMNIILMKFHPVVSQVEPHRLFAWKGLALLSGLADGEHIFEIEKLGKNKVRHIHRMEFTGLLLPLAWPFMKRRTAAGFRLMNEALKLRAEQAATNSQ